MALKNQELTSWFYSFSLRCELLRRSRPLGQIGSSTRLPSFSLRCKPFHGGSSTRRTGYRASLDHSMEGLQRGAFFLASLRTAPQGPSTRRAGVPLIHWHLWGWHLWLCFWDVCYCGFCS